MLWLLFSAYESGFQGVLQLNCLLKTNQIQQEKKKKTNLSPCSFSMGGWKTKHNLHEFSSLNTDKESSASSSSTPGCNTSGCPSIWNLTVLRSFLLLSTPFFSSLFDGSPWLTDGCVSGGTGLWGAWWGDACLLNFPDLTLVLLPDEGSIWGLLLGKMPPCCSLLFLSSSAAMSVPFGQPTSLFLSFFLSSSAVMPVPLEWPRFLLLLFFKDLSIAVFPSAFLLACSSLTSCIISSHISSSVGL